MSEKRVIWHLMDCAQLVEKYKDMGQPEVRAEVEKWDDDQCNKKTYFLEYVCALLPKESKVVAPKEMDIMD